MKNSYVIDPLRLAIGPPAPVLMRSRASYAAKLLRNRGLHNRPFVICQIARVTKTTAVRSLAVFGLPRAPGKNNGAQCDISTGAVIVRRILRVTPPSTNSRRRAWP